MALNSNYIHTVEIHNDRSANEILPYLFNIIVPQSVIDIGTGTGSWLKVAKNLGATTILGVDGNKPDQDLLAIEDHEFILHDLTLPIQLNKKFDLAICLEVVEHLPETAANTIIDTLVNHSDVILFSAAILGQGGQNHINEQWPEYWQEKFASKGFYPFDFIKTHFWNNDSIDWWYRQNILIYATKDFERKYGFNRVNVIPTYIHKGQFEHKINEIKSLSDQITKANISALNEVFYPKVYPSIKKLIKAVYLLVFGRNSLLKKLD